MSLVFSQSFKNYVNKCDNQICTYLNDYIRYNDYSQYFTYENINYITFRTDGTISYLPKGKQHIYDDNDITIWKRDNRQNGTPSKVIRKIISKEGLKFFTDTHFENFTNCYKSEFNDDGLKFELKKSIDIPNIYNNTSIAKGEGSLNGSCMNNNPSSYFDMYKHCKDLRILCLTNKDDELCGRALIWKLSDTITFMDRIYVVKDFYIEKFIEYATENEWIRKEKQSYDYKNSFVSPNGNVFKEHYKIKLNTDYDEYPYIDTFTYGGDVWLSNDGNHYEYCYTFTGGQRTEDDDDDDDNNNHDEIDDCSISSDDAYSLDRGRYRGSVTHRDNAVEINGHWWWNEDDDIVMIDGEWYEKDDDDITECSLNNEWYLLDDCTLVTHGRYINEYIRHDDTIEDVDGNVWYDCDRGIVEIDNEWYDKESDKVTLINGEYYLIDSDEYNEILNAELTN